MVGGLRTQVAALTSKDPRADPLRLISLIVPGISSSAEECALRRGTLAAGKRPHRKGLGRADLQQTLDRAGPSGVKLAQLFHQVFEFPG